MKTISTGTGLCALAGAVLLYPLLHRAEPQVGVVNTASAEPVSAPTQSRPPALQPPFAPAPPTLPPMGGGGMRPDGGVAMQMGGDGQCVIGEPLDWFTEVHPLPSCMIGAVIEIPDRMAPADIDGDGTRDYLIPVIRVPSDSCGWGCLPLGENAYYGANAHWNPQGGQFTDGDGVLRYSLSVDGETVNATFQQVVSTAVLQSAVCAVAPCGSQSLQFFFKLVGLYDVDGDGDLDLVAVVEWGGNSSGGGAVWLENTVPSDPPLTADINEDGSVDGKDLAMVLAAWTP